MYKLLLMIFLAVLSNSAMAEWVAVIAGPDLYADGYADPSTIRRKGNRVKIWEMTVFKTPLSGLKTPTDGIEYSVIKARNEYDCEDEKIRLLRTETLASPTSPYPLATDSDPKPKWKTLSAGSNGMIMLTFACSKK